MEPGLCGIIDSTLREGEQMVGVCFSERQRCRIIHALLAVGVDELELGVASEKNRHLEALLAAARRMVQGRQRLALWCRCLEADIHFAASCRPDVLSLSIPASDLHIRTRLQRDRAWVLRTLRRAVRLACELGFSLVSVGFEDATRADRKFLARLACTAEAAGAGRLRLADTVGIASPAEITALVTDLRQVTSLPLGIHSHNDFGMATANAVAATEAGASWLDATVLGLGERAGNCRLEEVVAFFALRRAEERYRTERLRGLCQLVSRAAAVPIGAHRPVVGSEIFTCETGLHQHGLSVNPATYEPYSPERVRARRAFRFGNKTGRRAICHHLAGLGIILDDSRGEALVRYIRSSGRQAVSDAELIALIAGPLSSSSRPKGSSGAGLPREHVLRSGL